MEKMDKINIYVPQNIGSVLDNDMVQFEIFKNDGSVNKNKFLTMLIQGYYDTYVEETTEAYNSILGILDDCGLEKEKCSDLANKILKKVILPDVPVRKGKNPIKLSLKPTKESIPLIKQIIHEQGAKDYISQFLCRMILSYCEKPFSERERIVFKDNYDLLLLACEKKQSISFTTIWNSTNIHEVIPYKLVVGQEEMFNYLLCGERNQRTGIMEAKSYRLNRISFPRRGNTKEVLSEQVEHYLEKMIYYAPQFAINDDEMSCVKLTEEGRVFFNRIYYGRPKVDKMVEVEDGWLFYFKCSKEQLYQYFKRFERNRVIILEPLILKQRLQNFHKQALKQCEEEE